MVSLPPVPVDLSALEGLAERMADATNLRNGFALKVRDWNAMGKVPGDDGDRLTMENDREIVVQVSPSTTDVILHYAKKEDLLHFIVGGQAFLVPIPWLQSMSRGLRRTQRKLGHGNPLEAPVLPRITRWDRVRTAGRYIWRAISPPAPQPDPVEEFRGVPMGPPSSAEALPGGVTDG